MMIRTTLICVAAILSLPAQAATLSYSDFSSTAGLQLNGNAAQAGDALRLTPAAESRSGSAFSTTTIELDDDASFSSFFSFNINQSGGAGGGADGIVFIVQTVANNVGGGGGGLGYQGIPNSLGIEFDTYTNVDFGDPNDNHAGIDVNGNITSLATATPAFMLETGITRYAWVDYNGATDLLEVRLSESADRPADALLSLTLDLLDILGTNNAFVGFSAGTGGGFANHDILSFEFRSTFDPVGGEVPEPAALGLLGLGFAGLGFARRKLT